MINHNSPSSLSLNRSSSDTPYKPSYETNTLTYISRQGVPLPVVPRRLSDNYSETSRASMIQSLPPNFEPKRIRPPKV